jgi:G10 protein
MESNIAAIVIINIEWKRRKQAYGLLRSYSVLRLTENASNGSRSPALFIRNRFLEVETELLLAPIVQTMSSIVCKAFLMPLGQSYRTLQISTVGFGGLIPDDSTNAVILITTGSFCCCIDHLRHQPKRLPDLNMPKIRTSRTKAPPDGFDEIEPTLIEFAQRLKDGTASPLTTCDGANSRSKNNTKRRQEEKRSTLASLPNQPSAVAICLRLILQP